MFSDSRLQALTPIWSWIPAFRAVAETEHLPSAARVLGVGPSTLSRSISMLERQLGKPLFVRSGRSLQLNDRGRALLAAVRDSMRRLEDGVQDVASGEPSGVLRIASSGAGTTEIVAPALATLRLRYARLLPHLITCAEPEVASEILRGALDVAFHEEPISREGLVTTRLASLRRGVYCGRHHPLFAAKKVDAAMLENAEFVAPPGDADIVHDGWPPEVPRRIALVTDQLRVGVEICIRMPLLAVLPDVLAKAHRGHLRRLPFERASASDLFATHRRVLGVNKPAAVELVELVAAASKGLDAGRASEVCVPAFASRRLSKSTVAESPGGRP
ncbi:MAG: LysR family transcriptional regulator [Planctomycetota bacterium]